jgi:spore germination protein GerM
VSSHQRRRQLPLRPPRRLWGWLLVMVLVVAAVGALWVLFGSLRRDRGPLGTAMQDETLARGEELTIWFASLQEDALVSEKRRGLPGGTTVERARSALQELIAGPKTEALRTLPAEAKVREVFIDDQGTAYVDFTEALSRNHPGGPWSEMLTIRSIIQTLVANIPQIKHVQILIEGHEVDTLAGHVDIRRPLATTWAINQR